MEILLITVQKAEVTTILVMVALTALSALASYLLRPKPDSPILDQRPTNDALRGGSIPLVIGRRRVGAKIMWVGDHSTESESAGGGGKGGGGDVKVKIHYERAIHALLIGPAHKLWGVYSNGSEIFKGPITPDSHPSGSTVNCGKPGSFTIFWGEDDQDDIETATGINFTSKWGFTSRFPNICYILWDKKRLGQVRQWTIMDYEVEVRAQVPASGPALSEDAWIVPTLTADGKSYSITAAVNGAAGVNYVQFNGKKRKHFQPGSYIKLTGSGEDGEYEVYDSSQTAVPHQEVYPNGYVKKWFTYYTRVYIDQTMTTLSGAGTADSMTLGDDDGVQAAHALSQLLFDTYPHGLGLDFALWDEDSFDAFSGVIDAESVPVNILAENAEQGSAVLASLMQDLGFMISWDPSVEKYSIQPVREPAEEDIKSIPDELIASPLPEIEVFHGDHPSQRLVFTFPARSENYKNGTINLDNDGDATFLQHVSSRSVGITNITGFSAADVVAQRRAQEEFGNLTGLRFTLIREARDLIAGNVITVEGIPWTLRVMSVEFDNSSGAVEIETVIDSYGIAASSFTNDEALEHEPPQAVEPDEAFDFVELPKYISPGVNRIIIPRIRAHNEITSAYLWISRDGTTYIDKGELISLQTGGFLIDAIDEEDATIQTNGPTFTIAGPDVGEMPDYSGDDENWRLGRMWVVIGEEIFFLQKVTAVAGDTYRLDGLIRARFDTEKADHAIGEPIFIFPVDNPEKIEDILLIAEKDLYIKVQPIADESIALADCPAVDHTLLGKGVAPMKCANLRTVNMINIFGTGEDVPLKWSYRSAALPKTGAGMQGAGDPTSQSPVEGEFVLRFRTAGDVLVKEVDALTDPTYTADNADLVSWFSGEPSSFKVAVTNVNGGLESEEIEITVTRV